MKILIATKNPGKFREIKKIFKNDFELLSLDDINTVLEIEENGSTFQDNAFIKARTYFNYSGTPTIADDGGLEIDALGGEPGVKSRRWPGYEASDEELIAMAIAKLHGVPHKKRIARLRAVGVYYDGKNSLSEEGSIEGYITENAPGKCEPGYPFRAIFWIPKFNKLFQDLTEKEHGEINHRKYIFKKLKDRILEFKKSYDRDRF